MIIILLFCILTVASQDISQYDRCPYQPTDYLFIVKASYYLTEDQWMNVKSFLKTVASSINIGRDDMDSQLGVALFDNSNQPKVAINIGAYGRPADLAKVINDLSLMPCGSWCSSEQQKRDGDQIAWILAKVPFKKNAKIIIISSQYMDSAQLQSLVFTGSVPIIQQVIIPQAAGVVTYDQPYYNYYQAYYDQYRRYSQRIHQMYPYLEVPVPNNQYPLSNTNNANNQYKWPQITCYQITSCQKCLSAVEVIENPKEVNESLNSGEAGKKKNQSLKSLPDNLYSADEAATTKVAIISSANNDDYEYEITGDPPGIQINKTPLKDQVLETNIDQSDIILE